MNYDNNFNMTEVPEEKIRSYKKTFTRISFSIFLFIFAIEASAIGISGLIRYFQIDTSFLPAGTFSMLLNALCIYGIGIPILFLAIRKAPPQAPQKRKVKLSFLFGCFAVVILFTEIGSSISNYLSAIIRNISGNQVTNYVSNILSNTDWYVSLIFVGIIGPFFEELIFRKIILSRLLPFGELTAIIFSSAAFALFHGNIFQLFYAFAFGAVCGYVFVKTGKFIYPVILHISMNVFCSVIPLMLSSFIDKDILSTILSTGKIDLTAIDINSLVAIILMRVYSIIILGLAIFGAVYFFVSLRKIRFEKGTLYIPGNRIGEVVFLNAGTIMLTIICTVIIALNTFV